MRNWLACISVAARVALLVSVLMVTLGLAASQQVLAALNRLQNERIREIAAEHVEALSVALGPLVLRNDIWGVYDTLQRAVLASGKGRVGFTAVADAQGGVLAATDPHRAPVGSAIAALAARAQALDGLRLNAGRADIRVDAPIYFQGRAVGQIVSDLNVADLLAERRRVARLLVIWNLAAALILALVGFWAIRRMIEPVALVAERMSGSDGAPEPIPPDEMPRSGGAIGQLAVTYNAMAAAVREKIELERRLADRERFVSLGRLSSSLAHEINNPLGGLLNAADTIQSYADKPEVVRRSAQLLERGLKHLRDVARATLEHNRTDRAGAVASREDFKDLKLLIGPEVRRRGQTLHWRVRANDATLATVPAATVRQIVLNLLLNASAAAQRAGKVALDVTSVKASLCITVADSGPGLSEAARRRLLSSDPLSPSGGVGLRLVHDLVEELGGAISVRERDGLNVIEVNLPNDRGTEG